MSNESNFRQPESTSRAGKALPVQGKNAIQKKILSLRALRTQCVRNLLAMKNGNAKTFWLTPNFVSGSPYRHCEPCHTHGVAIFLLWKTHRMIFTPVRQFLFLHLLSCRVGTPFGLWRCWRFGFGF